MVCCEDPLRKGAPLRPVGCPYEVTPEELHPFRTLKYRPSFPTRFGLSVPRLRDEAGRFFQHSLRPRDDSLSEISQVLQRFLGPAEKA